MNIVHTEARCDNCFKCIRNCAVKAILFREGQARILGNQCVLCGKCLNICPQQANHIPSQLEAVETRIKRGERVLLSVDPAYVAAFPGASFSQISAAFKRLGFWRVEESSAGGEAATAEYIRLLREGKLPNIITTGCIAVTMLIEKYFPDRVLELAQVASPDILHARMAHAAYGEEIPVVHLTGCVAKLRHSQKSRSIANVILFDEAAEWLGREGIAFDWEDPDAAESRAVQGRKYALPGGILSTLPRNERQNYTAITVDGFERCLTVLNSVQRHGETGFLFEMSLCDGGCVAAPAMPEEQLSFIGSKAVIYRMAGEVPANPAPESEGAEIDTTKHYTYTRLPDHQVSEAEIQEVFHKIGKDNPASILDCGTCGYNTCREKAIAVCQGRADLHMCLPYLRQRAESMSSLILDNTPNATLVIDRDMRVQGCNKAAQRIFEKTSSEMAGTCIHDLIPIPQLEPGKSGALRPDFAGVVYEAEDRDLVLDVLMVAAQREKNYIMIARDITQEQRSRAEIVKISRETIETTQKVIDKQMRVAQEIASLLGETTGETKAAISKLQRSLMPEDEA